ncbi:hypothetical protein Agabi119p4_8924 [Agaricus bisporus var. burnettii]|uniref:Ricin B lectin domain-containing protein n=1 Tax=Agaricus bisporus var. burnettii TaxID=192524 RepID=A0A8H7C4N5_AGABI|nr:hypothetical protein Agabi119p4_8924 [Agaricus bisporus var. burnettii]
MFQGLNQLIVLATLLSTGLGGFASPARRQAGLSVIKATELDPNVCADAGAGTVGTRVQFNSCNGGSSQLWMLDSAGAEQGLVFIRPLSDSSLCAGITGGDNVVTLLDAADCASNTDTTNWFPGDSETPAVGFLDGTCLTVDDNEGDSHPARVQSCIVNFDFTNTAGRQHIVISN